MSDTNNPAPVLQQERARASWRDDLLTHPACALFPPMSSEELRVLGADIIKNGLTSPIVLWSDGKSRTVLLDGRNRLDAIEIATSSPAMVGSPSVMAGKDFLACDKVIVLDKSVDPVAYVISAICRAEARPDREVDQGAAGKE
jgi:hypothetical protein